MGIDAFIRARNKARELAAARKDRLVFARRFLANIVVSYLPDTSPPPVRPIGHPLAREMGRWAATLDLEMAAYLIGTTYTLMLPEDFRSRYGVFYTPPSLTSRLLDLAEKSGVNWAQVSVLDPACGGGAFLAPVARRMAAAMSELPPAQRLRHIESHLRGYEIDEFAAWLSQVFVEATLASDIRAGRRPLESLVHTRDSLEVPESEHERYGLVVGNPPYGRVRLTKEQRQHWKRALYGHANLYGLFADLAAHLTAPGGTIAYVTPTSFLGGQYFSALRSILGQETPPVAFDFIAHREGVFADVLQETMLSLYQKRKTKRKVSVSYLSVKETGGCTVQSNGKHLLPLDKSSPWLLPRRPGLDDVVRACHDMPHRLKDLGYSVSTGPLVWNRHKSKLHRSKMDGAIPLIWAECVNPSATGEFAFKATTRNHAPWFKPSVSDQSNLVTQSCVLVQRTTATEQHRRLIAAALPQDFIDAHGGRVTVENHLNMVRPIGDSNPAIGADVIAALLNSLIVDQVFRCMSGSTAVSAYELEAMPLPPPSSLRRIQTLLAKGARKDTIERALKEMYANVRRSAAA